MADNAVLNSGSGGITLSLDELTGPIHVQRVKIQYGTDGNATDVSDTNPLPIDDAGGSLTVDNDGTFVVQENGAALTALQLLDNVVIVDDAAFTPGTTSVSMAGFTFDDTAPDSVNEGDAGAARMSANRNIYVQLRDAAGNERGLNVDASGQLAVTTALDGAISGSELQVDIVSSSTLTVDLGANNDVTIDNSSIVHAEDSAHSSGHAGIMPLAVRNDTLAALATTDGDYAPLQVNASGALFIQEGAALDVSGATVVVDATGQGDVPVTLAGEAVVLGAGSASIGTLGANSGVDIGDVDVTSLPSNTFVAEAGALGLGVLLQGDDGSDRKNVAVDATTGNLQVDLAASTNTIEVVGDVAHDAAAAGNPVAIAARATNSVEGISQVANADASFISSDLNGVLITRPHTTLEEILSERISDTGGTSTNFTTFGAGGAGVHNYVTTISISNTSSTDGYVDFRDGSGGSVIFTAPAPANGGSVINLPVPLKGAANTALAYDVSGALSTVYISVVGFQAQG